MTSGRPIGALRVIRARRSLPEHGERGDAARGGDCPGHRRAEKIWLGYVELAPGCTSAVHHHGEAESGIYIISGEARFYSGENLDQKREAHAGDFVWVPPHVVHVEMNASNTEPVRMVVARSTQAALTFNLPTPEGWRPT